jgi:hypothetical protein
LFQGVGDTFDEHTDFILSVWNTGPHYCKTDMTRQNRFTERCEIGKVILKEYTRTEQYLEISIGTKRLYQEVVTKQWNSYCSVMKWQILQQRDTVQCKEHWWKNLNATLRHYSFLIY